MSDECIHGFVDGMCASCNPRVAPAAPVKTRATRPTRAASPARATVRSVRAAARVPLGGAPADTVLEQRIYHLTHLGNLPGIVAQRAILAGAVPVVDLAAPQLRADRSQVMVGGVPDRTLERYVPFFLSPDATLWQSLRTGSAHPRLSPAVLSADSSEFVLLVSTVRHLVSGSLEFVVADGNFESGLTRFAATREDADRMLARLRAEDSASAILDAELLVAGSLPLEAVSLVGVQNDKERAAVREILHGSDFTPKISVYPPWFQPVD